MLKDTDQQPDVRDTLGKVWESPEHRSLELGCSTLPVWMCLPAWKLSKPHTIRFLWRLPHLDDQLLTLFLDPLPSLENGGEAENSKLLFMAWPFW